jgi:hypothetical protein
MEDNNALESTLTVHDDGFRVVKGREWGTEKYEIDPHLLSQFVLVVLGKNDW